MRISDWSSDVCSSDLVRRHQSPHHGRLGDERRNEICTEALGWLHPLPLRRPDRTRQQLRRTGHQAGDSPEKKCVVRRSPARRRKLRSEEHTSELQSLMRISYAVFCLKKKNKKQITNNTHSNKKYQKTKKHKYTTHHT